MKVTNMASKSGNKVRNQFMIQTEDGTYFQSYDAIIALKKTDGSIVLDERMWDYSRTTGKYRNQFLGESMTETRKKIESGEYKLDNLNPQRFI